MSRDLFWMYLERITRILIPFATMAIMARTFSGDDLATYFVATAFILYGSIFVEYGFGLSAIRTVITSREEQKHSYFLMILISKTLLALGACALFLWLASAYFHQLGFYLKCAICFSILLEAFSINWFLKAIERNAVWAKIDIAILCAFFSATFLCAVFAMLTPFSSILILAFIRGILWLPLVSKILKKSNFTLSTLCIDVRNNFRDGFLLFLMRLMGTFLSRSGLLFLGGVNNSAELNGYGGADRIKNGVVGMGGPLSVLLYSRILQRSKDGVLSLEFLAPFFVLGFLASLGLMLGFILLGDLVAILIFANHAEGIIQILPLFFALPPIKFFSNFFGNNILLPLNEDRVFFICLFVSTLVFVGGILMQDTTASNIAKVYVFAELTNSMLLAGAGIRALTIFWNKKS